MKVLIVADGHAATFHGDAYGERFKRLGHEVSYFKWQGYFKNYPYAKHYGLKPNKLSSVYYRLQNKLTFGPAVCKLNSDLVKLCHENNYDLVFVYRGTHIKPRTIKEIKKSGALVFGYNNDDPFSKVYRPYFWRHFIKSIPQYDHIFYYRHKNKQDYLNVGYSNISLLRSSYIKELNFKVKNTNDSPYNCDLIFIGHFENDGRDKTFLQLLKAGANFKLYGTNWHLSAYYEDIKNLLGYDVKPLYGADYNLALNSAQIAIVFLSKINNDTYTRRCFEIPATGTLMLAERTDDLKSMFTENEEAMYFSTKEEFLEKAQQLVQDKDLCQKVASAGYKKLLNSHHEVTDRVNEVIKVYEQCKK